MDLGDGTEAGSAALGGRKLTKQKCSSILVTDLWSNHRPVTVGERVKGMARLVACLTKGQSPTTGRTAIRPPRAYGVVGREAGAERGFG